ncbi:MAG TPA: undecaprenyl-diphosphate phosphatase [Humisphaera sp.]
MNDYLISVLLGVVEGLTEFLPVSSTAHLRIAEQLLGLNLKDPYWKTYSVVIQLGAILAVVAYFWRRLLGFVRTFPNGPADAPAVPAPPPRRRRKEPDPADGPLPLEYRGPNLRVRSNVWSHPVTLVMVAFVVTAGPAYLLDKVIGDNLEKLYVIGGALIVGGVVMALVDTLFARPTVTEVERMGFLRALWIGLAQILSAVFPGTSRSMVTIAAGQVTGMSRTAALEFSFFVSIPVMIAATGFKLFQAVRGKGFKDGEQLVMNGQRWGVMVVGLVVSFLVAWVVIAWFMAWVRKRGFAPFAVYRIVLGAAVLWLAYRANHP